MGNKPDWVELGKRINDLMNTRMWAPSTLASKAGVAHKTVTRIIDGTYERGPDLGTLRKVVGAFGQDGIRLLRDMGLDGWADTLQSEMTTSALEGDLEELIKQMARRIAEMEKQVGKLSTDLNKTSK